MEDSSPKNVVYNILNKTLYIGLSDGRILRPARGRAFQAFNNTAVRFMNLSLCGRYLATGGENGQLITWKLGTWSKGAEIEREWTDDILVL